MLMTLIQTSQLCFFADVFGRVVAEDVFAAEPLPPFPASIKDGYALIGMSHEQLK